MAEGIPGPGWHQVTWRLRANEHSESVPIRYFATEGACKDPNNQVHVYHGLGADKTEVESGARYLESWGVPAVGVLAPFYSVDIAYAKHLALEVPGVVANALSNGPVDLFGRSLGTLPVLVGGVAAIEKVRSFATLSPAGPTYNSLPKNPTLRVMQFASQFGGLNVLATLMRPPDLGDAAQIISILKELKSYRRKGGMMESLRYGVGEEVGRLAVNAARTLHESGIPHQHYLPRIDGAFLLRHQRSTLGGIGCGDFTVVPGAHTNGRSQAGKEQTLDYALWVTSLAVNRAQPTEGAQ